MGFRKLLLITALATMVLITTGCPGKYTGGGWIPGVDGGKANVGFNMHSDGENVKGQVQFNDHSVGVKFHGKITSVIWLSEIAGVATGTATINPGGETGTFTILVVDNGEPGNADPADYLEVSLTTPSVNYSNAGNLGGGNFAYHPPE